MTQLGSDVGRALGQSAQLDSRHAQKPGRIVDRPEHRVVHLTPFGRDTAARYISAMLCAIGELLRAGNIRDFR
jgi:hypothetical protein